MTDKSKSINWRHLSLELFVVFLGVTSGFVLNNWRINRNDLMVEQQYMEGFLQDTEENIRTIGNSITRDSLWFERADTLFSLATLDRIPADSAENMINLLARYSKASIRKGTWSDIINSGHLSVMRDFELKKQIVDYHMSIENVEFIDDYLFGFFDSEIMKFLINNFSFASMSNPDPDIINQDTFKNIFYVYYGLLQQREQAYRDLLTESDSLAGNLAVSLKQ